MYRSNVFQKIDYKGMNVHTDKQKNGQTFWQTDRQTDTHKSYLKLYPQCFHPNGCFLTSFYPLSFVLQTAWHRIVSLVFPFVTLFCINSLIGITHRFTWSKPTECRTIRRANSARGGTSCWTDPWPRNWPVTQKLTRDIEIDPWRDNPPLSDKDQRSLRPFPNSPVHPSKTRCRKLSVTKRKMYDHIHRERKRKHLKSCKYNRKNCFRFRFLSV